MGRMAFDLTSCKQLATRLQPVVEGKKGTEGLDSSTAGLVTFLRGLR